MPTCPSSSLNNHEPVARLFHLFIPLLPIRTPNRLIWKKLKASGLETGDLRSEGG